MSMLPREPPTFPLCYNISKESENAELELKKMDRLVLFAHPERPP